ncbi:MAG TPA: acyl carrier protein [Acidimicrobiales bacterium]|jgi:acyl carrier protein
MSEPVMDAVKDVLGKTLDIEDRVAAMDASTPLFGELPELDSLAVVELATALEDRFDITIDDDNFSGEMFETLGSLTEFVQDELSRA